MAVFGALTDSVVVYYQPKRLNNKLEKAVAVYTGKVCQRDVWRLPRFHVAVSMWVV